MCTLASSLLCGSSVALSAIMGMMIGSSSNHACICGWGTYHVCGAQPMQGAGEIGVVEGIHLQVESFQVMHGKAREPGVELFSVDLIGGDATDHDFANGIRGRNRREGVEYRRPVIVPVYRNAEEHET
ncbi:hypothetical protein DFH09DRAFT_1416244 [Mycena vulgaris]|nr:hypothetical protein DFH09DRAFT_1416244 [Mycena vulgaris]